MGLAAADLEKISDLLTKMTRASEARMKALVEESEERVLAQLSALASEADGLSNLVQSSEATLSGQLVAMRQDTLHASPATEPQTRTGQRGRTGAGSSSARVELFNGEFKLALNPLNLKGLREMWSTHGVSCKLAEYCTQRRVQQLVRLDPTPAGPRNIVKHTIEFAVGNGLGAPATHAHRPHLTHTHPSPVPVPAPVPPSRPSLPRARLGSRRHRVAKGVRARQQALARECRRDAGRPAEE